MSVQHETLLIGTAGRGFHEFSAEARKFVKEAGLSTAVLHCFVHHTSASLVIMENADPDVLVDLETWMAGAVTDGDPSFRHTAEGPDDMSAHIRSAITHTTLTIPVNEGNLDLGTWQGLYLWEHRSAPHRRRITLSLVGA